MVKNSNIFRTVCQLFAILFVLILSSPLITLAFFTSSVHNVIGEQIIEKKQNTNDLIYETYVMDANYNNIPPLDKPIYDSFSISERRENHLPTVLPNYKPYYGTKTVYLTFDDGPDPDNTPIVLDLLRTNNVKATFFVTGAQAEKYPELLKQIFADGHAIGNHSYNHIYSELYRSPESYVAQLEKTDDIIKKITGVRPYITRAPGGTVGSFDKNYWRLLKAGGYIEVGWNISSGDASAARANQIFQNIVHQLDNSVLWSHAIILMHDGTGHNETVKALPDIIHYLKKQGFEFRVVNIYTPPPW